MAVVKDMISQVESEHRSKLEQLNSLQQENRSNTRQRVIMTYRSWKVLEFKSLFQAWKVLETGLGPGKSWIYNTLI